MCFPKGTTVHPINKPGKNQYLVSVWDFGATHPQGERSHYICNDHPAKMRPPLARAILQLYGESPVLDPMAGIGTTLVEAMLLRMDAIGIEYENKFVKQANANIKHIQKQYPNLGKAVCIQGDARDLSCLNSIKVKDFNSIVFSPPFGDSLSMRNIAVDNDSKKEIQRARSGSISVIKNLPMPYSASKGNIGNLPYGFNSIVFSPPYFCSISDVVKSRYGSPRTKKGISRRQEYSGDPNNIGNIQEFGSIIFSPPYGEANRGGGIAKKGYEGKHGKDEKLKDRCDRAISDNSNNIGNILYSSTYLGEMLKVYRECYRVLKPNKFCVVVVKDIRRKGLTIPLGCDTVKLLQIAGFVIFDIVVNKMYFPSFWIVNHALKAQSKGIPMTLKTHEYVIVAKKVG